jgi:hypothetical protein
MSKEAEDPQTAVSFQGYLSQTEFCDQELELLKNIKKNLE